jgi:hypothetical protein
VTAVVDPSLVGHGRVNGRYFRENFAQGGIDLVQIIPELVTNADAAIALGGRPTGRIVLRFGSPDAAFTADWKRAMRRLRAPAVLDWRHELCCSDDGIGMDAAAVDRRLGALGGLPDAGGQRGPPHRQPSSSALGHRGASPSSEPCQQPTILKPAVAARLRSANTPHGQRFYTTCTDLTPGRFTLLRGAVRFGGSRQLCRRENAFG